MFWQPIFYDYYIYYIFCLHLSIVKIIVLKTNIEKEKNKLRITNFAQLTVNK